jgi:hypothetical protein
VQVADDERDLVITTADAPVHSSITVQHDRFSRVQGLSARTSCATFSAGHQQQPPTVACGVID